MESNLSLLICTNGSQSSSPALEYGLWLAELLELSSVILGVVESPGDSVYVEKLVQETVDRFARKELVVESRLEHGRFLQVIPNITKDTRYLTVISPLGRPSWQRLMQGRSFRRVLAEVETPLLYVPQVCLPLRKVLLCVGGLRHAISIEQLIAAIARKAQAEITVLHVVEPVTLNYPTARETSINWTNILETNTPQGKNLRQMMFELTEAGVPVTFKVRHGNPIHEILNEIEEGGFELLGLGSVYSTHSLRHLYMPNVTAEVAEAARLPLVTVRADLEVINPTDRRE